MEKEIPIYTFLCKIFTYLCKKLKYYNIYEEDSE